MKPLTGSQTQLIKEIEELRLQLQDANETIHAIRTGQIDALMVTTETGTAAIYFKKRGSYLQDIYRENEGGCSHTEPGLRSSYTVIHSSHQWLICHYLKLSGFRLASSYPKDARRTLRN
jgi:hypothetical protein